MSAGVEVFDGVASVVTGDVLIALWQAPARAARIRHITAVTERMLRAREGTIAGCQFLLPSASPPRLQERSDIGAGIDVVLPRSRRLVTVPLGDAAWQSVVRGVMKAGLFLIGQSSRVKVAANAGEAFALLGEVATSDTPDAAVMARALDALHEALRVPTGS
ncbi:MAG: hypothetical protein R3A52_26285 [Polyangiales bacterium]